MIIDHNSNKYKDAHRTSTQFCNMSSFFHANICGYWPEGEAPNQDIMFIDQYMSVTACQSQLRNMPEEGNF